MHFHGWNYIKKRTARQERSCPCAYTARVVKPCTWTMPGDFTRNLQLPFPKYARQCRRGLATSCVRAFAIAAFATLLPYRFDKGPSACSPRTPSTVVIYCGNHVRPCGPRASAPVPRVSRIGIGPIPSISSVSVSTTSPPLASVCATPRAVVRVVLTSLETSSRGATVSSKTSIVQTPFASVQTTVLRSVPSRVMDNNERSRTQLETRIWFVNIFAVQRSAADKDRHDQTGHAHSKRQIRNRQIWSSSYRPDNVMLHNIF